MKARRLAVCACVALASASLALPEGQAAASVPAHAEAPGYDGGYWVVRADGSVVGYGLPFLGQLPDVKLASPIVGGAATPYGLGYWLVAANGGVYSFGDARFFGSPGGRHLNRPIVGMAATPDGLGYWLVASDGGVFAYGDAAFYGSMGHVRLNKPIVGMAATPDGLGYWLVASDGGAFAFGDAGFFGSAGSARLSSPAVSLAPAPGGHGYWLAEANGTVLGFGHAPLLKASGAAGPSRRQGPLAGAPGGQGSRVVAIIAPAREGGVSPPATTTTVPSALPPPRPAPTTTAPPVPTSTTQPVTTTTTTPVTTTAPPAPTYSSPYPAGESGYDVSWPQCSPLGSPTTRSLPPSPPFAIVGVNGGTISTFNPCFSAEAAWAGPGLSVYIILQPAPANGALQEMTGPEASCAGTSSLCQGYDWGWNYAQADLAFVKASGVVPKVWWVDVETGEGWPTSPSLQPVNAAIVQGALDALRSGGYVVGIYSTWYQWGKITGSYLPGGQPPIWVPGAYSLDGGPSSAVAYCQRALSPGDPAKLSSPSIGFADGVPWLVQYGYGGQAAASGVDPDYACA